VIPHNTTPPSDVEVLSLLAAGNADGLLDRMLWAQRVQACYQGGVMGERLILGKLPHAPVTDLAMLDCVLKTAEVLLRRVTEGLPQWAEGFQQLAQNLWYQGRYEESLHCFAQRDRVAREMARSVGLDPGICVLIPRDCITTIGCMGHLDGFVKRKIMIGDRRQYLLLAPEGQIVNRVFLDYWSDYITIITDAKQLEQLAGVEPALTVNWNWVLPRPGGTADDLEYVHRGLARIHRQWRQDQRPPLLRLKAEHAAALARQKRAWGLAEDDWFICLHVRAAGFYKEEPGTSDAFRNTPVEDYVPMIREVVARGGWVIRMGDPSMPKLDPAQKGFGGRVIDYAHADERSAVLDVALCASCRVFVAAPSGLVTVAKAFGALACLVNYPMYAGLPWHAEDIVVPRPYFSREKGRVLSLEEVMSSDLIYADHGFQQERAGVELLRNTPEEIVEAVREALDASRYSVPDADRGRRVRAEAERLNRVYDAQVSANIGLHYAAVHADELCPSQPPAARVTAAGSP
jgi:putative glycosyltransferase (TIGR04372 family)